MKLFKRDCIRYLEAESEIIRHGMVRYLVLPQRPTGTEHLTEEQLAALITRDAMIGVIKVENRSTP